MIEKVITIAREAGSIIREGYRKNFQIEFKTSANNIVTEIDKKSEEIITEFIKKEFPSHSILAEESGITTRGNEYLWVIDPLDGTSNFAHGLPIFSVSIGLQKNEKNIIGVVYDVMRDQMYAAEFHSGSYCNGKKIFVSQNNSLEKSLLVTGFPYDMGDRLDDAIRLFAGFLKKSRAVRRLGSAAIDLCFVAEGVFDGFWEEKLNPWDICAGMLLVEEAGGKVTDFKGKNILITDKEILATNYLVHQQMLDIVAG